MCKLCESLNLKDLDHHNIASTSTLGSALGSTSGWSLDQIVAQLNRSDSQWNTASPVTYTFATILPRYATGEEYKGFNAFNAQQADAARLALSTWSDVANIRFWEVDSAGGKISFANSDTLASYSAAHAYFPSAAQWGGDVWVNSDLAYNTAPTVGNYGFQVLVHEIGHAIGQMHPGNYDANGGKLSYGKDAVYAQDSQQYTIMSYWSEQSTGADFDGVSAQTPMIHDILAIQQRYGINWQTRSDDTVYGFNSNTESPIYDFDVNATPVLAIWDGGGIDTLDVSGFSSDSVIDLRPGGFSSTNGMVDNISIAYGAWIENAVTGAGDDLIIGNQLDNRVDGGAGIDTFAVATLLLRSEIFVFTTGNAVIHSSEGVDQLTNIELVSFTDAVVELSLQQQRSIIEYAASYPDLITTFGTDEDMLYAHFLEFGLNEGRSLLFSAYEYIASHEDLIRAFGNNPEAAARHYIDYGRSEGREVTFDSATYLATHPEIASSITAEVSAVEIAELYIEAKMASFAAQTALAGQSDASVGGDWLV
jgi:serralysin